MRGWEDGWMRVWEDGWEGSWIRGKRAAGKGNDQFHPWSQ